MLPMRLSPSQLIGSRNSWASSSTSTFQARRPDPNNHVGNKYGDIDPDNYAEFKQGGLVDWETLQLDVAVVKDVLEQERIKFDSNTAPTTTTTSGTNKPQRTAADEFKRGVRRDISQFKKLHQLKDYLTWHQSFIKTARAQNIDKVFDPSYTPAAGTESGDELVEMNKFADDLLSQVLLLEEGVELIRDPNNKEDPRAVYLALKTMAEDSTGSRLLASDIMTKFSSIKWGDGSFKGTAKGYIAHVHALFHDYDSLQTDPIHRLTDHFKRSNLRNAVNGLACLAAVSALEEAMMQVSPSHNFTYSEYHFKLKQAADIYDCDMETQHGSRPHRKALQHDMSHTVDDLPTEILRLVHAHARINGQGQARMDIRSWKSLSADAQSHWDSIPEADKTIILGVALEASAMSQEKATLPNGGAHSRGGMGRANGRQGQNNGKRSAKLHELFDLDSMRPDQVLACMHVMNDNHLQQDATDNKADDFTHDQILQAFFSQATHDHDQDQATRDMVPFTSADIEDAQTAHDRQVSKAASKVPASDPRRMMSSSQGKKSVNFKDKDDKVIVIDNKKYYLRQVNMYRTTRQMNPVYEVSQRYRSERGALVDRGANGLVAGNDVRIISTNPGAKVDVGGIDSHRITDIRVGTVGGVMQSQIGEFIGIFHQAALHGKGRSIMSSSQMETFGVTVDDRSIKAGGKQMIQTHGYAIPIDIIDNLAYTPIRPFTDEEYETLPHVVFHHDRWTPNNLDCVISDKDEWYNAVSTSTMDPKSSVFDLEGNYKLRTISTTAIEQQQLHLAFLEGQSILL